MILYLVILLVFSRLTTSLQTKHQHLLNIRQSSKIHDNNQARISINKNDLARILTLSSSLSSSLTSVSASNSNNNNSKSLLSSLINIKSISIFTLVVQQSLLIILMRLSRIKKVHNLYLPSTAVLLCEIIKLIVSIVLYYTYKTNEDKKNYSITKSSLLRVSLLSDIIKYPEDLWKISIPSLLYVIQNNLLYIASSNVPAEIFQILSQGKIATTALFSSIMLNKKLNKIQWLSILALSLGVGLVQNSLITSGRQVTSIAITSSNILIGSSSILGYVLISGFAGAYLEGIIKSRRNVSLWTRNIQLGISSIIFAIIACFKDYELILKYGFFQNYDPLVISVILLQAIGGIIISMVVKQTSSVIKGFATAGSVILSCLLSSLFIKDFSPFNIKFIIGTGIVCSSVLSYSYSQKRNNNNNNNK